MQPMMTTPIPSQGHVQFHQRPPLLPTPHLTQGTQQPPHSAQQQPGVSALKKPQQSTSTVHSQGLKKDDFHSGSGIEHREHHDHGYREGEKVVSQGAYGRKGSLLTQQHSSGKLNPVQPRTSTVQEESPDHSHHNSWVRSMQEGEEEDPNLRGEFPDAEGFLFAVTLNKGITGLGLNIVSETNSKETCGIVIMGIQQGGIADQCGLLCWGDVILKMNGINVVGMGQEMFQKLLSQAPPTVTFVLLRQRVELVSEIYL